MYIIRNVINEVIMKYAYLHSARKNISLDTQTIWQITWLIWYVYVKVNIYTYSNMIIINLMHLNSFKFIVHKYKLVGECNVVYNISRIGPTYLAYIDIQK